jgi:aminopeptidase C
MSIAEMKEKLHNFIDTAKEEQVQAFYTILEDKLEDPIQRISIEQYNKELEEAEKEFEKGEFITNQEFINEMKKW